MNHHESVAITVVTVADMANAREMRAFRQREWLDLYHMPLISFTMNIAGPIKTSPLIRAGFELGKDRILYQLSQAGADVIREQTINVLTGDELLVCVSGSASLLKQAMVRLEESDIIGRLFDIDVLNESGDKLERSTPRRCLLCDGPAADCARSRTHAAQALFDKAEALLHEHFLRDMTQRVAETALRAVLFELLTTPKPGLVDRRNSGAHQDMDCFTFAASAAALFPWFEYCAQAGAACTNAAGLLSSLRMPGMDAERRMLLATNGVNTHKGAIFSLGILCAACGWLLGKSKPASVGEMSGACTLLAKDPLERELHDMRREMRNKRAQTSGQQLYIQSGITGARGEALRGFPTALAALDVLESALQSGKSVNDSGVETLLSILLLAEDSNFIKRSSQKRREELLERIKRMDCANPLQNAQELDCLFISENISPGGSADLLAATFFLHSAQALPPVPSYTHR